MEAPIQLDLPVESTPDTMIPPAPTLDYDLKERKYSKYEYTTATPINNVTSLTLNTSITNKLEFQLTDTVFNPYLSYFMFDIAISAPGAGIYTWVNAIGLPWLRDINVVDENGKSWCKIDRVNLYLAAVLPACMSLVEVLSNGDPIDSTSALHPANIIKANPFALIDATAVAGAVTGGGTAITPNAAYIASLNANFAYQQRPIALTAGSDYNYPQLEPLYNIRSATANAALTLRYRFDLKNFVHTFMAQNRNFPVGNRLRFILTFENRDKCAFTTATADGTDALINPAQTPTALAGGVTTTLSNAKFWYAYETNKDERDYVYNLYRSGQFVFNTEVVTIDEKVNTANATTGVVETVIAPTDMLKLKKIYFAHFKNTFLTAGLNTAFIHNNLADADGILITEYSKWLDGKALNQVPIDASASEDYLNNKRFLRGTSLLNSNIYKFNWVDIHSWDDEDKESLNYIAGEDTTDYRMRNYRVRFSGTANVARASFFWIIGEKIFNLRPGATYELDFEGKQLS